MDLKRDNLALPPSLTVYRLPKSPNIHATYKDNHTEVLFSSDNTEGLVSQVLSFEYVLPDRFSVRTVSVWFLMKRIIGFLFPQKKLKRYIQNMFYNQDKQIN